MERRYKAFEALAWTLSFESWWKAARVELPPKWPAPGRNMAALQERAVLLEEWASACVGEPQAFEVVDVVNFFELDPPRITDDAAKYVEFKVKEAQAKLSVWARCAICSGMRQHNIRRAC